MSDLDEECPVCQEKIRSPVQPSPCCRKKICDRCLSQSLQYRPHCPYCRSPQSNPVINPLPPTSRRHMCPIITPGNFEPVNSRPVGSNIQNLIGQLRNSQTHQIAIVSQDSSTNQAAFAPATQNQAPPPFISPAWRVLVPRSRRPNVITALQPAIVNAAPSGLFQDGAPPALAPLVLNRVPQPASISTALSGFNQAAPAPLSLIPRPSQDIFQAEQDDWYNTRTFACPYCQDDGLDELQLRNHCNGFHANDLRRVVCPVCVASPHGDSQYYSRDFIGHLNLRHCYYMGDITNLQQTDEMNIQCAILASFMEN